MYTFARSVVATAALTALAAAPSAWAAANASASIGTVTITLIDLDLDDDIAPSMTFSDATSHSVAQLIGEVLVSDEADGFYQPTSAMAGGALGEMAAATGAGGALAAVQVAGSNAVGTDTSGSARGFFLGSFSLTPRTRVTLSTTVELSALTTVGYDGYSIFESGAADGSIELGISQGTGFQSYGEFRYATASYAWDGVHYVGETDSFNGELSLTYSNLSDNFVSGYYQAQANAVATSAIPVPEPGTYAMLLAGLAGIGIMVRRRRG